MYIEISDGVIVVLAVSSVLLLAIKKIAWYLYSKSQEYDL